MANFILQSRGAMEPAERELLRFLVVAKEHEDETGEVARMPDCAVDGTWHRLLGQPARHGALGRAATGGEVRHVEGRGEGELAWVGRYERRHGALPAVWFTGRDGVVDRRRLAAYQEGGGVWAAWRCSPEVRPLPPDQRREREPRTVSVGAIA